MQRTEGKLSVKDNVKCALRPLQLHFILHSLSLMLVAFLLMMLNFFSVQDGLSTSQRLLSARSRYALLALCGYTHFSTTVPQLLNTRFGKTRQKYYRLLCGTKSRLSCVCGYCKAANVEVRVGLSSFHFTTQRWQQIFGYTLWLVFTFEEALHPQISHAETEDWQFVQARAHLLRKRQQVHQPVKLPVQPIPVALWRVGFNHCIALTDLLSEEFKENIRLVISWQNINSEWVQAWLTRCSTAHGCTESAVHHSCKCY